MSTESAMAETPELMVRKFVNHSQPAGDTVRDTQTAGPCGESIHWTHGYGAADDEGHPVRFVHSRYLSRLEAAFGAVSYMHRRNPEGIVPFCAHDGEPYPCETMRMLNPGVVNEGQEL